MERPILITGGQGMIGTAVLEALRARGVTALASGRHEADLLLPGAASALIERTRPLTLVHCGWDLRRSAVADEPNQSSWVKASVDLLKAFGRAGGRHATVIGTCAEYAWADGALVEDETPLRPTTVYGRAKRELHLLARGLAEAQGWTLAWPRVFWVYGPRERPGRLVPTIVNALLAGERVSCTDGRQERDYLYSGDVAHAVAELVLQEYEGAINLASGQAIAVRDVVTAIATEIGRGDLIDWGALPARTGEPARLTGNVRRLSALVPGWGPIPLADGVRQTVAWWREAV